MTQTSLTMYQTAAGAFSPVDFRLTGMLTSDQYTVHDEAPLAGEWRNLVTARLAELEGLAPGWDGEGGRPVRRQHANRAIAFLGRLMSVGAVPVPDVSPLADGGVQLEWRTPTGSRVDFITDEEAEPTVLLEVGEDLTETSARAVDLTAIRTMLGEN